MHNINEKFAKIIANKGMTSSKNTKNDSSSQNDKNLKSKTQRDRMNILKDGCQGSDHSISNPLNFSFLNTRAVQNQPPKFQNRFAESNAPITTQINEAQVVNITTSTFATDMITKQNHFDEIFKSNNFGVSFL